ncbi:GntR family transcriptional regulator [Granulicella sibirica]|uniref:Ribose operon repressor n=1 Tax=Granulicella sibirica TaxID=2479048 RepID=A0A4Q0STK6_9BACT|nr:GntR family transcriptional regulator [Granulicella sibirica]RXH54313.1 Ribose operon repressor [Granulicella sibirica]
MRGDKKKKGSSSGSASSPTESPRYQTIYEELLGEIESGVYKPGDRLPSEALLCERFQASRITVAKAFQTLQRDKLVIRRPGSGTYVNESPHGPSMQFGLLIPDLGTTEIFEPICQGMMRSPVAKSHSLSWGHTASNESSREKAAEQLCAQYIKQKVAGVFFAPTEFSLTRDATNGRIATMLANSGIPVVLLDRGVERYPDRGAFDLVGIDNHRAGHLLTRHLLQAGATRIIFAARHNSAPTVDARIAGYFSALRTEGNGFGEVVLGDFEDTGFVRAMLDRVNPDGIVCANDITAARLMRTLISLGVEIPGRIKIVGVDDVTYAKFLPVPLTTLRQDCGEIGAIAMSTMLDRLERPHHPVRDVLVRCDLVVRASSDRTTAS